MSGNSFANPSKPDIFLSEGKQKVSDTPEKNHEIKNKVIKISVYQIIIFQIPMLILIL